jgi:two-component system cell cycle response regulator CtrA
VDVVARLEVVERENALLRERIARLEECLGMTQAYPIELGLTPAEGRVFGVLMRRDIATKDAVMATLYSALGKDEADLKITDVLICKIRKKVIPFGVSIKTVWGQGWTMPSASKAIVQSMMGKTGEP